jgi:uncharacterized protein (DUF885 family)
MRHLVLALTLLLAACSAPDAEHSAARSLDESARLTAWLDDQYEVYLDFTPETRTSLGQKRDYDKLDDVTDAAWERQLAWRRDSVTAMQQQFDYEALSDEAKTSWDLWVYDKDRLERARPFRRHAYVFGASGPQSGLPRFLMTQHRVDTPDDLRAYIARLHALAGVLNDYLDRAERAVEDGIRQPRFNYDFAIDEIERVTSGEPFGEPFGEPVDDPSGGSRTSPLWADLTAKVAALQDAGSLDSEQADALVAEATSVLREVVKPAYDGLLAWLLEDRANAPTSDLGAWSLPNGAAYYDHRLFEMTTLPLSADEVHQTGLSEVTRLRAEMESVKQRIGFAGSLEEFFDSLREDERLYYPNTDEGRQAYLAQAEAFLRAMERRAPEYFGLLPKAPLEVRRVESFREQDGGAQHYVTGTPDGSRPGIFYAHLSDMRAMPKYQLEGVSYHEGTPGHHMQLSLAQERQDLPRFRHRYRATAFSEGWALYTETLAKEMGFYEDPYSDFGRLSSEMWRAVRLVADTGLHAKGWSEGQAVTYFLANSAVAEGAVRSEVKRYLANPGQATAYKIGALKIQELRARARAELGEAFDIRAFHDTVLGGGALPLPLLEARVERWIATTRGGI